MSGKIRLANIEDVDTLVELGEAFCLEYGLVYKRESISKSFIDVINHPMGFTMVVETEGVIRGLVAMIGSPSIFNDEITQASELMYYVTPEYRGNRAGIQLLKSYENYCTRLGYKEIGLICPEALKTDKLDTLYTKLGYKKYETTYIKEV